MLKRYLPISLLLVLLSAGFSLAQYSDEKLRAELLAMVDRDQVARNECAKGNAEEQKNCIVKTFETIDTPNTKRIAEIANATGFPTVKAVGSDGVKAFFLILQHSDSISLREKCKKGIEQAYKEKVLSPSEYTNFVDRLLVKKGEPQIYGSNFDRVGGKLVMSKTADIKNLDKRRKQAGLPPIDEYVKLLKNAYNLEVVTGIRPAPTDSDHPVRIISKPQASRSGCPQSNGVARVRATFDASGKVTEVKILESSGCPAFDRSILVAVRQIIFEPAMANGKPITVTKQLEYSFSTY